MVNHWQGSFWSDRRQAGQELAQRLASWHGQAQRGVVIGLPRGGVEVAAEVARALGLPLATWAVRKLAQPANPELALGAIAPGGVELWDEPYAGHLRLDAASRRQIVAEQQQELQRRQRLYGDPAAAELAGRDLLVIDDGIATGMTVRAALISLRQLGPASLTLAVPVADSQVVPLLRPLVDELLILQEVHGLGSVGEWFDRFGQVSDQRVLELLSAGRRPTAAPGSP
ncbi:MAG: phosphoribosyltransferase family protein [Prochlorococcaceae cyanobacterium]